MLNEMGVSNLKRSNGNGGLEHLSVHAIIGLVWLGKGLLMRGHEKVKDGQVFAEFLDFK